MASFKERLARRRIDRAAAKLTALERQVLVLSAREGLSTAQIGVRLDLTAEQVERLLVEALTKFDRSLERQDQRRWRRL